MENMGENAVSPEPASKKAKVSECIDNVIKKIENSNDNLEAILSDEYYYPMPFTKVYVAQIKRIQDLSKTIVILNQKLPLKELSHLKRAYRKEVILFPTKSLDLHTHTSVREYIETHIEELKDSFEYYKIIDVPAIAPKVKRQYLECGRSWSCHFHPDKDVESLLNGQAFDTDELQIHRLFMGMVFEVARYHLSQTKEDLELSDILSSDVNVTVIVDPVEPSVVAVAFDNRQNHPTQHSAMLAIDNVAKTQNGGAWDTSIDDSDTEFRGIGSMGLFWHLKKKYGEVEFGAKEYLTKSELEKRDMNPSECPYLCTGYNVYMLREPCLMCAMGLVHARASKVFFFKKHEMGALCSKTKLHCVQSLNHRFEVFTGFL